MKFNFKKIIGVVLTGATLAFSLVAGTGCSGGDVGKWFEDQYKQLTCEHKEESEITLEGVAPTCTEEGLTEGVKCGDCGKIVVKQDKISALGHTLTHFDEVEPSCLKSGLTEGDYCDVCDTWVVKQERVKATGHKVVTLEAVAATCTETGLTEGQGCENCGEVYKAQEIVAAKGHTFNDNHVCTTCSACDHSVKDYVCEYCNSYVGLEKTTLEDELEVGATYLVKAQDRWKAFDQGGIQVVYLYEVGVGILADCEMSAPNSCPSTLGLSKPEDSILEDGQCLRLYNKITVDSTKVFTVGEDVYYKITIADNTTGLYNGSCDDENNLVRTLKYNFGTEAFKVIEA